MIIMCGTFACVGCRLINRKRLKVRSSTSFGLQIQTLTSSNYGLYMLTVFVSRKTLLWLWKNRFSVGIREWVADDLQQLTLYSLLDHNFHNIKKNTSLACLPPGDFWWQDPSSAANLLWKYIIKSECWNLFVICLV